MWFLLYARSFCQLLIVTNTNEKDEKLRLREENMCKLIREQT